ncbi:MAG TPA: class I lanthipeptide, partial [Pyrinomonadaceae bacterium]
VVKVPVAGKGLNSIMVSKKKSEKSAAKSRVKVGKLQLGKETIKDLRPEKQKEIKGGLIGRETQCVTCSCRGC